MSDKELGLAEVINKGRDEIVESVRLGRNHSSVKFEYTSVEVDFEVAVTNEAGGNGGIKVWVVSAEAQAKRSNTQTHRVKVVMTPRTRLGEVFVNVQNEIGAFSAGPVTLEDQSQKDSPLRKTKP
jgi:hypothetical protein